MVGIPVPLTENSNEGVVMFEWLEDEIARIKTRKFHVVDGPLSPDQRALVENATLAVPPSYKIFVIKFGNAKLYRLGSQYRIQIYAAPGEANSDDGDELLHFGRTDSSLAYFKPSRLVGGSESPVFEWRHEQGIQESASGFEEWLTKKCNDAKRSYKKKNWREIEIGPPPFTEQEKRIVEARRYFRWRVSGVTNDGNLQFEVYNGSNLTLPFLTIAIRGKRRGTDAVLSGGIWLPVDNVLPGQTAVVEKDCYKQWVDPQDVEAYDELEPGPEDRDRFWEFKTRIT